MVAKKNLASIKKKRKEAGNPGIINANNNHHFDEGNSFYSF